MEREGGRERGREREGGGERGGREGGGERNEEIARIADFTVLFDFRNTEHILQGKGIPAYQLHKRNAGLSSLCVEGYDLKT